MDTDLNRRKNDFIQARSVKYEIASPVCEAAEWQFLFFMYDSIKHNTMPSIFNGTLYSTYDRAEIGSFDLIKKRPTHGLGTYLCPNYEVGKLWIAASGNQINNFYKTDYNRYDIYPLRPLIENPDDRVLSQIYRVRALSPSYTSGLLKELEDNGYMGMMLNMLCQIAS